MKRKNTDFIMSLLESNGDIKPSPETVNTIDNINNVNKPQTSLDIILNNREDEIRSLPRNKKNFLDKFKNIENNLASNKKIIYIENSDFLKGTYRIINPGIYILKENIILEPNDNQTCFPLASQNKDYPMYPGPYILGFFAGISIETDNVILDLNGFSIKQSLRFYLLQRFFSTIELANSPFIPKPSGDGTQGPANFGPTFRPANNVIIRNGNIGLSSHHAIHGNSASNILIENITIDDFEVGGIALNGVNNVYVHDIKIINSMGTNLKVPVNGRFSAAVYIWRTFKMISDLQKDDFSINIKREKLSIRKAYIKLDTLIKQTVEVVEKEGLSNIITNYPKEIYNLFGNPGGFQDCSAIYGILFNKKGVAINEFGACDPNCKLENHSKHIIIENCEINNLVIKPREVVALLQEDNTFQKDFSGSMIMAIENTWFNETADGINRFNPNLTFVHNGIYDFILANQVLLYRFSKENPNIKWAKGVANITKDIENWVTDGTTPLNKYFTIKTARNTDIMGHVMKGAIAIRLDFVSNCQLDNNKISEINNYGNKGISNQYLGGYIDATADNSLNKNYNHFGHPKSDDLDIGYTGGYTRGISVTKCQNVSIIKQIISELRSDNSSVIGIDFIQKNLECQINQNIIKNLLASLPNDNLIIKNQICFKLPNWIPRAIGILFRTLNQQCRANDNHTENIKSLVISNSLVVEASGNGVGGTILGQDKITKEEYEISNNVYDARPQI